ncbi:MAG: hypothetical protein EBY80_10415 [Actinobacteria bacterium]|nr:hypothetical protein [Actinomycetota bacterium]
MVLLDLKLGKRWVLLQRILMKDMMLVKMFLLTKKNTYQKMNIFKAPRKNHGYFYTIQLVGKIPSIP